MITTVLKVFLQTESSHVLVGSRDEMVGGEGERRHRIATTNVQYHLRSTNRLDLEDRIIFVF